MVLIRHTLIFIFIFAPLFFFFSALCVNATSKHTHSPTPTPTPTPAPASGPSPDSTPSSTPSPSSSPTPSSAPTPSSTPSPSPTPNSISSPSSSPTPTPSSTPTPTPSSTPSPTPTPTPTPTPAPTPSNSPSPSPGPTSDDDDDDDENSSLLKLRLPYVGVQKKALKMSQVEGSELAKKQLQGIEHKIDEFKAILTKRLADPKTSEKTQRCLAQCEDNFEDAIDDVKLSIESINKQDLPKANADVSAISTDVDTCNDCFKELMGEDQQIKTFDDWIRGVTGDCLENLKKT